MITTHIPIVQKEFLCGSSQVNRLPMQILMSSYVKNLFKGAAVSASTRPGPIHDIYVALVAKGMRPDDGPSHPHTKDCHHHFNHVEERRELRPPTVASASREVLKSPKLSPLFPELYPTGSKFRNTGTLWQQWQIEAHIER
jgi:hypothetical protein